MIYSMLSDISMMCVCNGWDYNIDKIHNTITINNKKGLILTIDDSYIISNLKDYVIIKNDLVEIRCKKSL